MQILQILYSDYVFVVTCEGRNGSDLALPDNVPEFKLGRIGVVDRGV